jgi:hypothetical protein
MANAKAQQNFERLKRAPEGEARLIATWCYSDAWVFISIVSIHRLIPFLTPTHH